MTIPDLTNDGNKRPMFRRKKSSWMRWIWRIFLILAFLIAIFLGILSLASGTSEERRAGIESLLSEVSGQEVIIEKLNYLEIFPTLTIDMEGVHMQPLSRKDAGEKVKKSTASENNPSEKAPEEIPDNALPKDSTRESETPDKNSRKPRQNAPEIHVGRFMIKVSFWDYLFGLDSLKDLEVSGLRVLPQQSSDQEFYLQTLALEPDAFLPVVGYEQQEQAKDQPVQALPGLIARGQHGLNPFFIQIHLPTKRNSNQNITDYVLDRYAPFLAAFGPLAAKGKIRMADGENIETIGLSVASQGQEMLTGRLTLGQSGEGYEQTVLRRLQGSLSLGKSSMAIDLAQLDLDEKERWKGDIFISPLLLADFAGSQAPLTQFLTALEKIDPEDTFKDEPDKLIELDEPYFDLTIRAEPVNAKGDKLGELTSRLVKTADRYALTDLDGKISKGKLSGQYILERSSSEKTDTPPDQKHPFELSGEFEVLDLDYGALQETLTDSASAHGDADINVTFKGKGLSEKELRSSLSGRLSVIAGNGRLTSSSLNFWGGGLINSLVPTKDEAKELRLNCALMDFKISEGIGKADSFFLDTERVQVVGKGKINFMTETVDLVLTPNSKNTALFDVATAINVQGPFYNPSFSPNTLSLGKKIGGLLLGAVNPAFLAVSMTDFGISKEHPCLQTIEKLKKEVQNSPEENPAPKAGTKDTDLGSQQ